MYKIDSIFVGVAKVTNSLEQENRFLRKSLLVLGL